MTTVGGGRPVQTLQRCVCVCLLLLLLLEREQSKKTQLVNTHFTVQNECWNSFKYLVLIIQYFWQRRFTHTHTLSNSFTNSWGNQNPQLAKKQSGTYPQLSAREGVNGIEKLQCSAEALFWGGLTLTELRPLPRSYLHLYLWDYRCCHVKKRDSACPQSAASSLILSAGL